MSFLDKKRLKSWGWIVGKDKPSLSAPFADGEVSSEGSKHPRDQHTEACQTSKGRMAKVPGKACTSLGWLQEAAIPRAQLPSTTEWSVGGLTHLLHG